MINDSVCIMNGLRTGAVLFAVLFLSACARELIVLLPDDEGGAGVLALEGESGSVVLDRPLAAAKIGVAGRASKTEVTQTEIQQTFSEALAAEPPKPRFFTLYFLAGSTQLNPESKPVLDALMELVNSRAAVDVEVTGHTDPLGGLAYNDQLSLKRANEIKGFLSANGLDPAIIRTSGRGEREPVPGAQNSENRRVVVTVR